MNNKGQSVLAEYGMIFFVVIAAAVAMTTYVQRGLEARIHDTRNYMINSVMSSSVCDSNCLQATGGNIDYEYEPYYSQVLSNVLQGGATTDTAQPGNPQALGVIYNEISDQNTGTNTTSNQLPPGCANGGCG